MANRGGTEDEKVDEAGKLVALFQQLKYKYFLVKITIVMGLR